MLVLYIVCEKRAPYILYLQSCFNLEGDEIYATFQVMKDPNEIT